jgi:hypothetical protein
LAEAGVELVKRSAGEQRRRPSRRPRCVKLWRDINEKIRKANRNMISGPPFLLVPYDLERVVCEWREQHSG